MQLANYAEHFASLDSMRLAVQLLLRSPRNFEQLCRDVQAESSYAYKQITNTINFLIDSRIFYLDYENKVALTNKGGFSNTELIDKITHKLTSEPFFSMMSPTLVNHYEIGLCVDGGRLKKELSGLVSLYFGLGIIKTPVIGRFWPVTHDFESVLIKGTKAHLNHDWKKTTGLSLEELKRKLANQEKAGEEAELWVLSKEKERLKNHPFKDEIARISEKFVTAGFDIVSFKTTQSLDFDKFIEVKSFANTPEFYLTSNEVDKAKELGSNYILVVVDRSRIGDPQYKPIEIINPYNVLLTGDLPKNISITTNSWRVSITRPSAAETN
jgi:hypothetical protein